MTPKKSSKSPLKVSKGLSIDDALYQAATRQAHAEGRSFASFVRRAIEHELAHQTLSKPTGASPAAGDELMPISEVCERLKVSVWTVRRHAGRKGDPLRLARSRVGKQKPMHFLRSRIEQMERELSAA